MYSSISVNNNSMKPVSHRHHENRNGPTGKTSYGLNDQIRWHGSLGTRLPAQRGSLVPRLVAWLISRVHDNIIIIILLHDNDVIMHALLSVYCTDPLLFSKMTLAHEVMVAPKFHLTDIILCSIKEQYCTEKVKIVR